MVKCLGPPKLSGLGCKGEHRSELGIPKGVTVPFPLWWGQGDASSKQPGRRENTPDVVCIE